MHKTIISVSYADLNPALRGDHQYDINDISSILKSVLTPQSNSTNSCIFITSNEIQYVLPYINKIQKLPNKCHTFYVLLASGGSTSQLAQVQQVCSTSPILYPSTLSHLLSFGNISHSLVNALNTTIFNFFEDSSLQPNQICLANVGDHVLQQPLELVELIQTQVGEVLIPHCEKMIVAMGRASVLLRELLDASIGVNTLYVFSPFPSSQLLRTTPKSVKMICVVERMDDGYLGNIGPLYLQVVETFGQSVDFPDAHLLSFTFLGEFTSSMVECIKENLNSQSPKTTIHYTPDMETQYPPPRPARSSTSSSILTSLQQQVPNARIWAVNINDSIANPQVQSTSSLEIGFGNLVSYLQRRSQFMDLVIETVSDPLFTNTELRALLDRWIAANSEQCNTSLSAHQVQSITNLLQQELSLQPCEPYRALLLNIQTSSELLLPNSLWLVCDDQNTEPSSIITALQSNEKIKVLVNISLAGSSSNVEYKNLGLYVITHFPSVYVFSVSTTGSAFHRCLREADNHGGPSLVVVFNDRREFMEYRYYPDRSQIVTDDENVQAKLNSLIHPKSLSSLVVQREPVFQSSLTDSHNNRMTSKFEQLLSSFTKLATGLNKPILVLYGSDGGAGEAMARKLSTMITKKGLEAKCLSCNELSFDELLTDQTIIFVVSTSGQGKFPLNAGQFWKQLLNLPDDTSTLIQLKFSVFGLGDSQFWKPPLGQVYFCKPAKDLDKKLQALGAVQLIPICCGDDQNPGGPEESFSKWVPEICKAIGIQIDMKLPEMAPPVAEDVHVTPLDDNSKKNLTKLIRERGLEMGLSTVAFTRLEKSECGATYEDWVAKGYHGEMGYLSREDAVQKRKNPTLLAPGTISAIVATLNYDTGLDPEPFSDPSAGIFARYAQGEDYHDILKPRLMKLQQFIQALPQIKSSSARVYVDTGPILERELARKAGIGWFGKNTMMITPKRGSYFFLGVLLIDLELEYDQPFTKDMCGGCSACLPACPTGALLGKDPVSGAPVMDARRCISYLTIEQKGPIPRELRKLIGNRIYGCDICQEVCPWNQYSTPTQEPAFAPKGLHGEKLVDLLHLTQTDFSKKFKGSAIKRTKRRGLLRNVAVALGNWRDPSAVPHLIDALKDEEALVRGHSAWALGQIGGVMASQALQERLNIEGDNYVQDEILLALKDSQS